MTNNSGRKVLIIDDDRDFAQSLAMILDVKGYDVREAHSLHDARAVMAREEIDVFFLDLKLRDGSGESFLPSIRTYSADALIIVMTGFSTFEIEEKLIGKGASLVARKPVEIDQVIGFIEGELS